MFPSSHIKTTANSQHFSRVAVASKYVDEPLKEHIADIQFQTPWSVEDPEMAAKVLCEQKDT